jgi:hypothetical protein
MQVRPSVLYTNQHAQVLRGKLLALPTSRLASLPLSSMLPDIHHPVRNHQVGLPRLKALPTPTVLFAREPIRQENSSLTITAMSFILILLLTEAARSMAADTIHPQKISAPRAAIQRKRVDGSLNVAMACPSLPPTN